MKNRDGQLELSATDISNFLGCRHRIGLEMSAAAGEIAKPVFDDPQLEALFRRGCNRAPPTRRRARTRHDREAHGA